MTAWKIMLPPQPKRDFSIFIFLSPCSMLLAPPPSFHIYKKVIFRENPKQNLGKGKYFILKAKTCVGVVGWWGGGEGVVGEERGGEAEEKWYHQ